MLRGCAARNLLSQRNKASSHAGSSTKFFFEEDILAKLRPVRTGKRKGPTEKARALVGLLREQSDEVDVTMRLGALEPAPGFVRILCQSEQHLHELWLMERLLAKESPSSMKSTTAAVAPLSRVEVGRTIAPARTSC